MMQLLINAEESHLLDVLEYIRFTTPPTCAERAQSANEAQKQFLECVLAKYVEWVVAELNTDKLPDLLVLKYRAIGDM